MILRYSEALAILVELAHSRGGRLAEALSLLESVGRISAREVRSQAWVPPFDNSAMDGFALCSRDTPASLAVAGSIAAGDGLPLDAGTGQAWEIMTGAAMPGPPFDCVVKVEDVERRTGVDGRVLEIQVKQALEPGENVRGRGLDFAPGQVVLREGERIRPEHLMALAAVGVARVEVLRQPRIDVLSTGDELVPHDRSGELGPGQIRNSTAPYLLAGIPFLGARARFLGPLGDDPRAFQRLLDRLETDPPDLLLTTGAVSMGRHDFIEGALQERGARILYHRVAIRPGKPGLVAELGRRGPVVFGVPGNPVSTAVALRFFIEPYLRALAGRLPEPPLRARLQADAPKPEGLRCFFKARFDQGAGEVSVLAGQPSFMVSPLLEANAWVVLPEEERVARAGLEVEVFPLWPETGFGPAREKEPLAPAGSGDPGGPLMGGMLRMIQVNVRLFGALRDHPEGAEHCLELPAGARVSTLRERLAFRLGPGARETLLDSAFASDTEILAEDAALRAGCTIAVLPPVCGG